MAATRHYDQYKACSRAKDLLLYCIRPLVDWILNVILHSYFQSFIQKHTQIYHKHIRTDDKLCILSLNNGEPGQIKMTDSWGWRMRERGRSCEKLHKWLRGPACPLPSLLTRPLSLSWTDSLHTALLSTGAQLRQSQLRSEKLRCWHCCRIRPHCQQVSWTQETQGRC